MLWIWLVLLYGVIKGIREIVKKKSMEKNSVIEVLFVYTLLSFLMVIPTATDAFTMDFSILPWVIFKSFVIFIAWILGFKALRKIPISLYGLLDLSRVIFSTLLGVFFLHEKMAALQIVGLILVCGGLLMCRYGENFTKRGENDAKNGDNSNNEEKQKADVRKSVSVRLVVFVLISSFLNGVSGTMDKALMQKDITSSQLQFWYMLFLVLFYGLYLLFSGEKVHIGSAMKNYWIWILSIIFVIGDKALFIANQSPNSRVTVMTLLKQVCCIVTILAGKFIYKEKRIAYKLVCAAVIITGMVVAVMV